MNFVPSYSNYREILRTILSTNKYCDFSDAVSRDSFIVLRHDIEFSVERAHQLAMIESGEGIFSTYFVQITNNAYNAFSHKNQRLLKEMHDMGHHIGLHFHVGNICSPELAKRDIIKQINIFSDMCGMKIDRFSIHRPKKELCYNEIQIDGVINAYSPAFFTLVDTVDENTHLDVKYIADSQHRWNYGFPDKDTLFGTPKIQLLVHPDFWSVDGFDSRSNFADLIHAHTNTFIDTLDTECNHFAVHKNTFSINISRPKHHN